MTPMQQTFISMSMVMMIRMLFLKRVRVILNQKLQANIRIGAFNDLSGRINPLYDINDVAKLVLFFLLRNQVCFVQ
jgi:hypothetical protein